MRHTVGENASYLALLARRIIRGAMDDEQLEKLRAMVIRLSEELVTMAGQITALRASMNVLKLLEAYRQNPDDPAAALSSLRDAEQVALKSDPNEQERQQVADAIEFLKRWKKGGSPPSASS